MKTAKPTGLETLEPRLLLSGAVVINEIMYNPPGGAVTDEFIELYNTTTQPLDLSGWQLTGGVDLLLSSTVLQPGQYVVLAADPTRFAELYPAAAPALGPWQGRLSNSSDKLTLTNSLGVIVDEVNYADQGAWSFRYQVTDEWGYTGWEWDDAHDAGGSSLELVNPLALNELGQYWLASSVQGGTPGQANSTYQADPAPVIADVDQSPVIPRSDQSVTVTAEVVDLTPLTTTPMLNYRLDGQAAFTAVAMQPDGANLFTGVIPAQAHGEIVEFYVSASDASVSRRFPAQGGDGGVNLLYQVDDAFDPADFTDPSRPPQYRIIMTESERAQLETLGAVYPDCNSNAQANGAFITIDATGLRYRYEVGVRNRGHGSRDEIPHNYRVNIPSDHPLRGATAINLNAQYSYSQVAGSAIFQAAGLYTPSAMPVQVTINSSDMATDASRTYGLYAHVEALDSDFVDHWFAQDASGNLYKCLRLDSNAEQADLRYEGPDPDPYRHTYFKQTNASDDNWTDLINLTDVLNNTPAENLLAELDAVMDVRMWMRYLALNHLMNNTETSLNRGYGDDYAMYAGADGRFVPVVHDMDSFMGIGWSLLVSDLYLPGMAGSFGLLYSNPEIMRIYYQEALDLIENVVDEAHLRPLLVNSLGGWVPDAAIDSMVDRTNELIDLTLEQMPTDFSAEAMLPQVDDTYIAGGTTASFSGYIPSAQVASVTVDGQPADLDWLSGLWSLGTGGVQTLELISAGSNWRYLDDGSNQGSAWSLAGYDDSAWASGEAQLGYGDGDEATVISYGPNSSSKYITTYFRRTFNVDDPAAFDTLQLQSIFDDGLAVYINGVEVVRDHLGAGADYLTTASSQGNEDSWYSFSVDPSVLVAGQNVIAVEVHQSSPTSSDLSFDLSLTTQVQLASDGGITLDEGLNRVEILAFDDDGAVVDSRTVTVWKQPAAVTEIAGGSLAADATWTAAGGPYRINGSLTVPAGVALTIEAGSTVYFEPGTQMTIAGRLVVDGAEAAPVRLTRWPNSPGDWNGLQFASSMQDNIIRHAIIEYGSNSNGMIGLDDSQLLVENTVFDHCELRRIRTQNSSLIVRDSRFEDIYRPGEAPSTNNSNENIWGGGIPAGGQFLLENNYFGSITGHNDGVDFDGPGTAVIRNNFFAGGGDDALDLECDAWIEGNIFQHYHKDVFNTDPGESNVISAGAGHTFFVIGNTMVDIDHASLIKEGSYMTFVNNTVVDADYSVLYFDLAGQTDGPGRGAYVENNIFHRAAADFSDVLASTDLVVNYNLVDAAWHTYGEGNLALGPMFVNDAAAAGELQLDPASPAYGNGRYGGDIGAGGAGLIVGVAAGDVWVSGDITLYVHGCALTEYVYSLDGAAVSPSIPAAAPIVLNGLTDGTHTLSVRALSEAGFWSDFQSVTWTVDSTAGDGLYISEILADNANALDDLGQRPDYVELFNDSPTPIDVSGMSLSDDPLVPAKFIFPTPTIIPARGRLVVTCGESLSDASFGLSSAGDSVLLYDPLGNLVDSVSFGRQVEDVSLSRLSPTGDWLAAVPTPGEPESIHPQADPRDVLINEWFTQGIVRLADDYIELYNPHPGPADIGGFYLTDNPIGEALMFQLPALTIVPAGGYLVLDADDLPFGLSSKWGMIGLSTSDGSPVDEVFYFTQGIDYSHGRNGDGAADYTYYDLPTPGAANPSVLPGEVVSTRLISFTDIWHYYQAGNEPAGDWTAPDYNDIAWPSGAGLLYVESSSLPATKNTPLTLGANAYYFRSEFNWQASQGTPDRLDLSFIIDDGAVFYLNGVEIYRYNMLPGAVTYSTESDSTVGNAGLIGPIELPAGLLVDGRNVLAVEVHQRGSSSSDIVMGMQLDASSTIPSQGDGLDELRRLYAGLRVSEIMYHPTDLVDVEYLELINISDQPLDLTGVRIGGGIDFTFPAYVLQPGAFVVVASDPATFAMYYGVDTAAVGPFDGKLSNGGEEITLLAPAPYDAAILRIDYADTWQPATDGGGASLIMSDPRNGIYQWSDPISWTAGRSPGGADPAAAWPVFGDLNGDGFVDQADLDKAGAAFHASEANMAYDFNSDLIFDQADLDTLVGELVMVDGDPAQRGSFYGDANLSGSVDIADFVALKQNYGTAGGWAQADFNGDGVVDIIDFVALKRNYGQNRLDGVEQAAPPAPAQADAAVTAEDSSAQRATAPQLHDYDLLSPWATAPLEAAATLLPDPMELL